MESVSRLGATHLAATMATYGHVLRLHQDAINALNVYPVPDGDTGTNMALTLESVVAELSGIDGLEELAASETPMSITGDSSPGPDRWWRCARPSPTDRSWGHGGIGGDPVANCCGV